MIEGGASLWSKRALDLDVGERFDRRSGIYGNAQRSETQDKTKIQARYVNTCVKRSTS